MRVSGAGESQTAEPTMPQTVVRWGMCKERIRLRERVKEAKCYLAKWQWQNTRAVSVGSSRLPPSSHFTAKTSTALLKSPVSCCPIHL